MVIATALYIYVCAHNNLVPFAEEATQLLPFNSLDQLAPESIDTYVYTDSAATNTDPSALLAILNQFPDGTGPKGFQVIPESVETYSLPDPTTLLAAITFVPSADDAISIHGLFDSRGVQDAPESVDV
jgi:hypothetical protein